MFKDKKYVVVRKAISYEIANFAFNYFLLKKEAVDWMYKNNYMSNFTPGFGTYDDNQIPNTYSCYSDFLMETLMMKVLPIMEKHTDLRLIPTYSYTRAYKKGDILYRHKDRSSCEISASINLGGDIWPLHIHPTGSNNLLSGYKPTDPVAPTKIKPDAPEGVEILLEVGDLLIYSGCGLEHWRTAFEGNLCVQALLQYNNIDGPFGIKNKFDQRPMLGIPTLSENVVRIGLK